jgi:hypothetical protein
LMTYRYCFGHSLVCYGLGIFSLNFRLDETIIWVGRWNVEDVSPIHTWQHS